VRARQTVVGARRAALESSPAAKGQLQTANCKLRAENCELKTAKWKLKFRNCQMQPKSREHEQDPNRAPTQPFRTRKGRPRDTLKAAPTSRSSVSVCLSLSLSLSVSICLSLPVCLAQIGPTRRTIRQKAAQFKRPQLSPPVLLCPLSLGNCLELVLRMKRRKK